MIKTYEATFTEEGNEAGIFGISLVKNPAYEKLFIALSEQEKADLKKHTIEFKTVNEDERLLVGLVIEPDKPIYRNENGEEFNVVFKADTIKEVAYNFFKQDFHRNSTIEHDKDNVLKGVTFVESWLVRDSKKDIGVTYGMDNPKGSWLVSMKVDDEKLWKQYIKTGIVKGFSIDGFVKLKEIKAPKGKIEMGVVEALKQISNDFLEALKFTKNPKEKKYTQLKLGEIKMEDGEVMFEFEGEVLEAGVNIFAVDPADPENKIPVPPGTYPLEDGRMLVVVEEGIVSEVKERGQSSHEDPEPPKPEDIQAGDDSKAIQEIKSILIKYEDRFKVVDEIKKELEEVKAEVLEFGEAPGKPPRRPLVKVELNGTGRMLEALRKNESN